MPLVQQGLSRPSTNIDRHLEEQIKKAFSIFDHKVDFLSRAKGLTPTQVRLLQPLHCCVLVGNDYIFVILSVHDIGSISIRSFHDWPDDDMDLPTAVYLAERDLSFKNAFGFQFLRSILDLEDNLKAKEIFKIAEQYFDDEISALEKKNRIVKINPIFQGREFLQKDRMVFVLSPYGDPFDTIYSNHIEPTIKSTNDFYCLRADDIYDNRAIVEDIWRHINEARILISELTGKNANVFYETGIAHTIGKEVILITQSMEDVPFDLKHLRCIVYDYTLKSMEKFENKLKNTILHILSGRDS